MLSVGLTGGIASGKSLAAGFFSGRGALVLDADIVAREAVMPGSQALERIADRFGTGVLDPSGALDREKLGSIVFADQGQRKALERILHPLILSALFARIDDLQQQGRRGIVVSDLPLLFECGLQDRFDATVLVFADAATQQQRLCKRSGLSPVQARQRLDAQMPIAEKRRLADFIIDNTGSPAELESRVAGVWDALCRLLQKKG